MYLGYQFFFWYVICRLFRCVHNKVPAKIFSFPARYTKSISYFLSSLLEHFHTPYVLGLSVLLLVSNLSSPNQYHISVNWVTFFAMIGWGGGGYSVAVSSLLLLVACDHAVFSLFFHICTGEIPLLTSAANIWCVCNWSVILQQNSSNTWFTCICLDFNRFLYIIVSQSLLWNQQLCYSLKWLILTFSPLPRLILHQLLYQWCCQFW